MGGGGGGVTHAVNLVVYLRQDVCVDSYLPADNVHGASEVWKWREEGRGHGWFFKTFKYFFSQNREEIAIINF